MISYKDFLIENTNISKKFYNDFFKIFKEEEMLNTDEFLVNYEKLKKWLKLKNIEQFRINIKNNFIENKDYIIKYPNKNLHGGHNKQLLLLTMDTALQVSMNTGKRGMEVSKYFIEVNKALLRYKDLIYKKLQKETEKLRYNMNPTKPNNNNMYIYVIKAQNTDETNNLHKIGKTKDIKNRLNNYNSGLANDNNLLFWFKTDNINQVEGCLKNLLLNNKYRKNKEVYDISLIELKKLIKLCDIFIKSIELNKKNLTKLENLENLENLKLVIKYE